LPSASPGASAKTASATSTRRRLAARGRESERGLHRGCSVTLDGADRQPGEARILEDPLGHSLLFSAAVVPELSDCAQSSTIAKTGASLRARVNVRVFAPLAAWPAETSPAWSRSSENTTREEPCRSRQLVLRGGTRS